MLQPRSCRPFFSAGLLIVLAALVLTGCATPHGGMTVSTNPVPAYTPPQPTTIEKNDRVVSASLWSEDIAFGDLFSDPKARRSGDVLTIKVAESSSASNEADTNTNRESSLTAGIKEFFGVKTNTLDNLSVSGSFDNEFKGKGSTSRKGSLDGFITARVVEVMPNGNLKIVGSREIMVNNEKQIMAIYGVVRPRDISEDNVVLSTSVADARIVYSGAGIVDDRQRPGWASNALNTIWPF